MEPIFPFEQFWWFYASFCGVIVVLLYSSIKLFHKDPKSVTPTEAVWSALSWFGIAMLFNLFFYFFTEWRLSTAPRLALERGVTDHALAFSTALEFLTGYVVEKALAVDNLFVFIVIFRFFGIPNQFQYRVLFYGLFGAILLRAIFIGIGSVVMSFHLVVVLFGIFLMYQGVQVLIGKDDEIDPENNVVLKTLNRYLPVSKTLDGQKFFTWENGKRVATPLLVVLIFVELTDVMFAFDSVPAIFGLTKEPLVVFTSNIFAVIDLRALYFLLAAFIDKFYLLNYGLGCVLLFIGAKMSLLDWLFGGKFPTLPSLLIVFVLIAGSIGLSLLRPQNKEESENEGSSSVPNTNLDR
jgi:tellurite resistance protein TerC